METTVSSLLQGKVWHWKPARSEVLVSIQSKLPLLEIAEKDKPIRIPSKSGISNKFPEVNWWKIIWYFTAIPRHTSISWLAFKNRWSTQDRLLQWGTMVLQQLFIVEVVWKSGIICILNVLSQRVYGRRPMRCYLISRPELDGRKLLGFSHFDV